jgi:hypothetical protein
VTEVEWFGYSESLKNALEWAFDAAADDELVSGCIKTCIALEAALGEDAEEGGGITERLADRYAFLIGNTAEERTKLRANMRAVYQLRSKLVHGKKAAISHKDSATARSSQICLDSVLKIELKALENWAQRK